VWLHQGEIEILTHAPTAGATTANLEIEGGQVQQTLPVQYWALLDITTNLGIAGTTQGRDITRTSLDRMQAAKPSWRRDRSREVRHYMQDERDERTFYVWPALQATAVVEARLVVQPVLSSDLADVLTVGDKWLNAMVDYVLYKAFSQDGEEASNLDRAMTHYMAFAQTIGLKLQKRAKAGPGGNAPQNPAYPLTEKNGA
jgi:hypothetical protein